MASYSEILLHQLIDSQRDGFQEERTLKFQCDYAPQDKVGNRSVT